MSLLLTRYQLLLILLVVPFIHAAYVLRRHDQLSLLSPFHDLHSFYSQYGAIEIKENVIRFGRGESNQMAAIWSKTPSDKGEWQWFAKLRARGDPTLGGNGFALWYVKEGHGMGPALGAPDRWTGLGIFVDTYDDDHQGNNPAIYAILNDGNMEYRWQHDGEGQYIGGCLRALRNTDLPFGIRVTHMGGTLKVELTENAEAVTEGGWVLCFEKSGIKLPPGYYFGISASTNDHPDEMELKEWTVHLAEPLNQEELARRQKQDSQSAKEVAQDQPTASHQPLTSNQPATVNHPVTDGEGLKKAMEEVIQRALSDNLAHLVSTSLASSLSPLEHRLNNVEVTLGQVSEVLTHMGKSLNDLAEHAHHQIQGHDPTSHGGSDSMNELKMRLDQLTALVASKMNSLPGDDHHLLSQGESSRHDLPLGISWRALVWFVVAQMILVIVFWGVKHRWDRREKKML